MKQIILIRHAKVDMDNSQKIESKKLQDWANRYDSSEICKDSLPTQKTVELAKNANIILTSSIKRTQASAKTLSLDIYEKNSLFNEAMIPDIDVPLLKLSPMKWLLIIRLLSFLNFGKIGLSLKESRVRGEPPHPKR